MSAVDANKCGIALGAICAENEFSKSEIHLLQYTKKINTSSHCISISSAS
jgi:hypothetical protein